MRQKHSRRPVWEFADRVQITRSVLHTSPPVSRTRARPRPRPRGHRTPGWRLTGPASSRRGLWVGFRLRPPRGARRRQAAVPTMNLFHPQIAAALAAAISLAACIAPPAAPTIPVAPGPSKTLEMFGADQAACQQNAAAQLSPAVAAANNQAVGGALLGGALGAGLGAGIGAAAGNAGKGAAIGAASGGASGSSATRMARLIRRSRCSSSTTSCTGSAWPPAGTLSPASPCPQAPRPNPENSRPTLTAPRLDHANRCTRISRFARRPGGSVEGVRRMRYRWFESTSLRFNMAFYY